MNPDTDSDSDDLTIEQRTALADAALVAVLARCADSLAACAFIRAEHAVHVVALLESDRR